MKRITIRVSNEQAEALAEHGGGDVSRGVRMLVVEHLGAGEIHRPRPFEDTELAKKAVNSRRRKAKPRKGVTEISEKKTKKTG